MSSKSAFFNFYNFFNTKKTDPCADRQLPDPCTDHFDPHTDHFDPHTDQSDPDNFFLQCIVSYLIRAQIICLICVQIKMICVQIKMIRV